MVASASGYFQKDRRGEIKVWNAVTGQEIFALQSHVSSIMSVAFSVDGKVLASAGMNWQLQQAGEVKLWDMTTGKEIHSIRDAGNVFDVEFSRDGHFLGLAGADGRVRLYDPESWEPVSVLSGHRGNVFSISFSPDGTSIASGGS